MKKFIAGKQDYTVFYFQKKQNINYHKEDYKIMST